MNVKPKQAIIIGGGSSLKEGINMNLWNILKNRFVIGINYSFKFFTDPTVQCFVDFDFYNNESKNLSKLGLIIGKHHKNLKLLSNTVLLPCSGKFNANLKEGVYKGSLTGLFALTLTSHLLDTGEIFLLGYDEGSVNNNLDSKNRKITHWYQNEIEHRGIGKTSYYEKYNRGNDDFEIYLKKSKCKIYNVSLNSKITCFDKLSYLEFFNKLDYTKEYYNQTKLRDYIKSLL